MWSLSFCLRCVFAFVVFAIQPLNGFCCFRNIRNQLPHQSQYHFTTHIHTFPTYSFSQITLAYRIRIKLFTYIDVMICASIWWWCDSTRFFIPRKMMKSEAKRKIIPRRLDLNNWICILKYGLYIWRLIHMLTFPQRMELRGIRSIFVTNGR